MYLLCRSVRAIVGKKKKTIGGRCVYLNFQVLNSKFARFKPANLRVLNLQIYVKKPRYSDIIKSQIGIFQTCKFAGETSRQGNRIRQHSIQHQGFWGARHILRYPLFFLLWTFFWSLYSTIHPFKQYSMYSSSKLFIVPPCKSRISWNSHFWQENCTFGGV